MKSILALATLAFVVLVLDEKTRQIAGEAHDAYGETATRVRAMAADTRRAAQKQPLAALLIAGTAGLVMSWFTVRR